MPTPSEFIIDEFIIDEFQAAFMEGLRENATSSRSAFDSQSSAAPAQEPSPATRLRRIRGRHPAGTPPGPDESQLGIQICWKGGKGLAIARNIHAKISAE
jgi:hypothetical protein